MSQKTKSIKTKAENQPQSAPEVKVRQAAPA